MLSKMRTARIFLRCWHDIRLLLLYRQYSHRRLLTLLALCMVLWMVYKGAYHVFHGEITDNPKVDHWCDREELPSYLVKQDPEEITIVTAYFNLGTYKSGPGFWDYTSPHQIKQWMRPLGRIANPVVAYVDDDSVGEYFLQIRSCLPNTMTQVIKLHREELWSFRLQPYIERIYSQSDYPKHYPNTVSAGYTCSSHAKYELLESAVRKNFFKTPFFAWLDIDYFKRMDKTNFDIFKLIPPATFNMEMIATAQAWPHDPNIPAREVIENNLVWTSGAMLLGVTETILNLTSSYRQTVEKLLKDDLSSTDEQIIYIMFSAALRHQSKLRLKTYLCHEGQLGLWGRDARFLCLGYVCKNAWDKIHKPGLLT